MFVVFLAFGCVYGSKGGELYVSLHYLCFVGEIFLTQSKTMISVKDIIDIAISNSFFSSSSLIITYMDGDSSKNIEFYAFDNVVEVFKLIREIWSNDTNIRQELIEIDDALKEESEKRSSLPPSPSSSSVSSSSSPVSISTASFDSRTRRSSLSMFAHGSSKVKEDGAGAWNLDSERFNDVSGDVNNVINEKYYTNANATWYTYRELIKEKRISHLFNLPVKERIILGTNSLLILVYLQF